MNRASCRVRTLRNVLAALAATSVFAVSQRASADDPRDWKPFAFWSFSATRTLRMESGGQRGTFSLSLTSVGGFERTEIHGSFREEYSQSTRRTRCVPCDGSWSGSLEDLHYKDPDGDVVWAGEDAQDQGTFAPEAGVNYFTDQKTKQSMIAVKVALPRDAGKIRYQYHPLEVVNILTVRVSAKVKDAEHRVDVGGFSQSAPFTPKQPMTFRQRRTYPAGEESWVVRRFGKEASELVIVPDHYRTWMPRGQTDERTPGNQIVVRARLQGFRGTPLLLRARRIYFELEDVSREPGIALNWPPPEKIVKPPPRDLQIDPHINKHLLVPDDREQQKAQTPEGEYTESFVVISAYDWGAFGALRVKADLADGSRIVGHMYVDKAGNVYDTFSGDEDSMPSGLETRTQVLLPRRKAESRLPDEWRRLLRVPERVPDDEDEENEPPGNGVKGDGLSLYEEYRGFYEDGKHIEGNVRIKDLFVRRETRSLTVRQGVGLFASASGIVVHGDLDRDELPMDKSRKSNFRVINCNAYSAFIGDQHGLIILKESPGWKGGLTANYGPPRYVDWIKIHPVVARFFRDRDDALVVAHELGHAVSVPHHGDRDVKNVEWKAGTDDDGRPVIMETPFGMDGTTVDSDEYSGPVQVFDGLKELHGDDPRFRSGWKIWVAREQGQHSGEPGCLMRYDVAGAIERKKYVPWRKHEPPVRELVPPGAPMENFFCSTIDGPPPFGPADQDGSYGKKHRGNCIKQIWVNDNKFP